MRGRAGGRGGQQPVTQLFRGPTRCDAQFGPQGALQPLELTQRGTPVTSPRQLFDQLEVGSLVGGINGCQHLPATGQSQQIEIEHAQPVPDILGPRLVGILG